MSGRPRVAKVKVQDPQKSPAKLKFHTSETKENCTHLSDIESFKFVGSNGEYEVPADGLVEDTPDNRYFFEYTVPNDKIQDLYDDDSYQLTIYYTGNVSTVCPVTIGDFDGNDPAEIPEGTCEEKIKK